MEHRAKRNPKSVVKGPNGYSNRRSSNRSRDLLLPPVPSAAGAEATGELHVTGTSKNALRERTRVESLRRAYLELQAAIPSVPPNTKLSKLDVLVLATTYISHLSQLLQEDDAHDSNNNSTKARGQRHHNPSAPPGPSTITTGTDEAAPRRLHHKGLLHPVKKWPMRARLYAGVGASDAVSLIREQPIPVHQPEKKLVDSVSSQSQIHSPVAPSQNRPVLQHTHATPVPHHKTQSQAVDYTPSVSETYLEDFGPIDHSDKSYGYPYMCGGVLRQCEGGVNSQCAPAPPPPPYPGSYMHMWEVEGGIWDSNTPPCDDPSSRHSPCHFNQTYNNYMGYWSTWND